jgi:microsomal dipeptidase-like Zn-dependent dipeptidase/gamma-glutamyl-gamma-aminobutyrate hydrolase PuuD
MTWNAHYQQLTTGLHPAQRRPLIGITGNYEDGRCTLNEGYYKSVREAGGIPVILPPERYDMETLSEWLRPLDGLLLSGGADINPLLLGEEPIEALHGVNPERDLCELLLARMASDRQLPILGICKGVQVLTVALGGTVLQDIWTQHEGTRLKHSQQAPRDLVTHSVSVAPDSLLFQIYGKESVAVNSFHHQAVGTAGPLLRVCGLAPDGVVEAVEASDHRPIVGVQWHPECLADKCLFDWLVAEGRLYRESRQIHDDVLTLDSHCDTPMFFDQQIDFTSRDPRIKMDLHKMAEGGLDACIMVAYLEQLGRTPSELEAATHKADRLLTEIEAMVARAPEAVGIARTPDDLLHLKHEGRKAIMLGIENGYAIGADLANVERFRRRGVVYMTLCHNGDNDLCDSAKGQAEHGGVSDFGAKVIQEMNRVGMMVDLSHAAEQSFYDALDISRTPIVCSHSSARALCDHPRNLRDDQLRSLARAGGVAQVTLYPGFLRTVPTEATVLDAVAHLDHMIGIMGIDHVGIGSDFDGDGGVPGCNDASEMLNFTRHLLRRRYSSDDLRKIWGENFLRVMREVQAAGCCIDK